MYRAKIYIKLKDTVLDSQGTTVKKALIGEDFNNINDVKIGKYIIVDFEKGDEQIPPEEQVTNMCSRLLVNPVIEEYTFDIEEV